MKEKAGGWQKKEKSLRGVTASTIVRFIYIKAHIFPL